MFPVSDAFLSALRGSHERALRVEVWRDGTLLMGDLPVESGSVTVDERSRVRRTANLVVADPDLLPQEDDAILSTAGTELRVLSGVRYADGSAELVPVGVFRVSSVTRRRWGAELDVVGEDLSATVADGVFWSPTATEPGIRIPDEIAAMVTRVVDVDVLDLSGSLATTAACVWDSDRWGAIEELSTAIGCETFFTPTGAAMIRRIPSVAADPVWIVDAGDGGVLLEASQGVTRDGMYNGVIAYADDGTRNSMAPTGAYALQRSGPLRWRKGLKKPRFYMSPLLKTKEQCRSAAESILQRANSGARQLSVDVVPNPALDVGDTVLIRLPDGTEALRVITKLTLPLGPTGGMQLEVRGDADFAEGDLEPCEPGDTLLPLGGGQDNGAAWPGFPFVPTPVVGGFGWWEIGSEVSGGPWVDVGTAAETQFTFTAHFQRMPGVPDTPSLLVGLRAFDVDGLPIGGMETQWRAGTTTTLAADLSPGDTVVQLTDASGWVANAPDYDRVLIFWDYVDGAGTSWPAETYSRHTSPGDAWDPAAWTSGATIPLRAPWAGDPVAAGTEVSQLQRSWSHMFVATGQHVEADEWTRVQGTTELGYAARGQATQERRFLYGTRYVTPLVLWTAPGTDGLRMANVDFRRRCG